MPAFPTYAPEFEVRINGEPLPPALRGAVGSVSYQDGIEGADRVELVIANPGLRWLDDPLVQVDNGFRLFLGYAPDPLEEVFVGEITGVEPTFPNGSMPTIKIVAQDFLNRLTKGTKDRAFKIELPSIGNLPLPDLAVAGIVSGFNGLIPLPDPVGGPLSIVLALATALAFPSSAQKGVRRQRGMSDFAFLSQLSKENGWQMYIDHTADPHGRVLRFQFILQDPRSEMTLKWGSSLMEFSPRLTTVGDVFGVSARVWVDTLQMEFVIVVSWDFDKAALHLTVFPDAVGPLEAVLGEEASQKTISIKPTGYAVAPVQILRELLPRLMNRLTGSGSTIGDLRMKAGRVVTLEGLGSQFSGPYRLTSVTHSLNSSGFRSSFTGRMEPWFQIVQQATTVANRVRTAAQPFL
jgi:hypothetical protein